MPEERSPYECGRWPGLVLLTLGFVWSGSRGGFIALAAVGGFIVIRYTAIPLRWRLGGTGLIFVVLAAAASDQYLAADGHHHVGTRLQPHGETGRLQIWSRGLGYMMSNPVFGLARAIFRLRKDGCRRRPSGSSTGIGVRWNAAHNSFVQAGAELAVSGLVVVHRRDRQRLRAPAPGRTDGARGARTGA